MLLFLGTGNCDENNCNDCAQTDFVYVCLDEFHLGFCYDTDSVDPDSIRPCPDGGYCVIGGGDYCSSSDTALVGFEKLDICKMVFL